MNDVKFFGIGLWTRILGCGFLGREEVVDSLGHCYEGGSLAEFLFVGSCMIGGEENSRTCSAEIFPDVLSLEVISKSSMY